VKIGELKEIKGYIPHDKTDRWQREKAEYLRIKPYIAVNVIAIIPVVLVTVLLARKAFASQSLLIRWLGGGGAIVGGLFSAFLVFFIVTLAFYDTPGRKGPGGPWVDEYESKMTFVTATQLLGHEPKDAWQNQINDSVHLLANKEILLFNAYEKYVLVPAGEIQGIRRITEKELASMPPSPQGDGFLNMDSNAAVVSLILNEPAHHEWNPDGLGPFEITLNTPRPHSLWLARSTISSDRFTTNILSNENFIRGLMKALGKDEGKGK